MRKDVISLGEYSSITSAFMVGDLIQSVDRIHRSGGEPGTILLLISFITITLLLPYQLRQALSGLFRSSDSLSSLDKNDMQMKKVGKPVVANRLFLNPFPLRIHLTLHIIVSE